MASQNGSDPRPLSPHLSIYRWGWTMSLSILHRMTGVALSVGIVVLTYWLLAISDGPGAHAYARDLLGSPVGQLLLAGWTFALIYHLLNGIRHLIWDTGTGLSLPVARASGLMVVVLAVLLTALVLWRALGMTGGVA